MIKNSFLLLTILQFAFNLSAQNRFEEKKVIQNSEKSKVIIEGEMLAFNSEDSAEIFSLPLNLAVITPRHNLTKQKITGGYSKISIYTDEPLRLYSKNFHGTRNLIAEPGDSIYLELKNNKILFSGTGCEKFNFLNEIEIAKNKIKKPSDPNQFKCSSITDFIEWNAYLNNQLKSLTILFELYENKITSTIFRQIKFDAIGRIEEDRKDKFGALRRESVKLGITCKDLCNIFDSTFYGPAAMWMRSQPIYHSSWNSFVKVEVWRNHMFNENADSLHTDTGRKFLYYNHGKKLFNGKVREEFFLRLIAHETIYELGFTPETELLLDKYYSEPGYPEYKKLVKEYENSERIRSLTKGKKAPAFELTFANGKRYTLQDFSGKVLVVNFLTPSCSDCKRATLFLDKIEREFLSEPNVCFLKIYTGIDNSIKSKKQEQNKYAVKAGINLYPTGHDNDKYITKAYNLTSIPQLYLLDGNGRIVTNSLLNSGNENKELLVHTIRQQLLLLKDGPYVIHTGDSLTTFSINGLELTVKKFSNRKPPAITIATDNYKKTFKVHLKGSLEIEPCRYEQPQKLVALSDIEGNFKALKTLLLTNKVIDDHYNWTFGKGHLVIAGDMFDRGQQVTECLWLIYSLEEKAKKAGGYVHFILGNHEIMTMNGNTKYAQPKYREYTIKSGKTYAELYSPNSELGKWLRTKNIVEKIGNILFTHAGISREVLNLSLTIEEINQLARPYYDKDSIAEKSSNTVLKILFNSKTSPFWYRLYYQDQKVKIYSGSDTVYKASTKQIDETLEKFEVSRIITGHTIIADTISVHFNGKVINIDTKHAEGESEALRMEGNNFYRVNCMNEKIPLPSLQPRKQFSSITKK